MTNTSLRLLGLSASLALPLSAQTVTTLLDDAFTDADRTNQSLPSSARWLTSGTNSTANIDASGGALFNKATVTNLAYFTTAGAPVALAVGESLTLTFEVSFSAVSNSAAAFRVGFYNSGSRLAADNFGNGAPEFSAGYAGYFGGVNTAATSNNIFRYYERGTSTTLIGGSLGTAGYVQTGGNFGGAFKVFATNSVYTAQLVLTRTGETSLNLSQSYTGFFSGDSVSSTVSGSINDTSGLTTSFDTLAFLNNTSGANFTLDNVRLDYLTVSTIPEPSSAAALAGALVLSAGALRRRRRA